MRLLKRYEELIERDADDISILWKLLQMLFYLVTAVAGYITTYTFYIFQDLLSHRCILWATPSLGSGLEVFFRRMANGTLQATEQPWQDRLNISFKTELHCSSILMVSILSCACGIIGFSFFSICGRGGYEVRIYHAPWRLVVPAIVLNFCLSLLSLETAYDFDHGFDSFQHSLNKLLNRSGNEPMMEYLQTRNKDDHQLLWKYIQITKISSWIGAAAWMLGLFLLILRVVNVTDFRLLRVSIYATKARADEPRDDSYRKTPGETST